MNLNTGSIRSKKKRMSDRRTLLLSFEHDEESMSIQLEEAEFKPSSVSARLKIVASEPQVPSLLTEVTTLRHELDSLLEELNLIVKSWNSQFSNRAEEPNLDQRLRVVKNIDLVMLERMVENPYLQLKQTVFSPAVGTGATLISKEDMLYNYNLMDSTKIEVALSPARKMPLRFLLVPSINLATVKQEDRELLSSLAFNVLDMEQRYKNEEDCEEYLTLLIMTMYVDLGLVHEFNIDQRKLYRFILTICRKYRNVPFHNFYHAFNVTQTMYYFLTTGKCLHVLDKKAALAMLTATLCHDVDHPGLNNGFLVQAGLKIGTLHKRSTLENHHLLQAMSVLQQPECNIFSNIPKEDVVLLGHYIRDLILATDLSLHGVILRNMEARKKRISKEFSSSKPSLNHQDKVSVMTMVMKCSDLSNEIRVSEVAKKWATRINREFFCQCDMEIKLNLNVSSWMDYKKIILAKEQINFISGLCMPLYKCDG
eukprot:TRINITY_DN927_c0_g1_i17.p1 TRINITY_DN927_c0_g1~~TRINITY_DN927_c0_g1_i17.p1  ORF type:complete len:482 (+),score=93.35 TRINITY_DN927_c0_g1_i17:497-1942(+)